MSDGGGQSGRTLGARTIAAYAAGSLGTGVFSTVPTALLLYYCTEVLGIAAAIAGLLVFAPKVWSIIWDPLVGTWSDRTRSRWGRRLPFLLAGAVGVALGFAALFSPPLELTQTGLAIWVAGAYFFLATVYSLYAVPYIALPAEITGTPHAQTNLVAYRMVAGMAGVFLGASGAPLLVSALGGGRAGYAAMSLIIALVCLAAMMITLAVAPRTNPATARPSNTFLTAALAAVRAPGFFRLLASYYLLITGVSVVIAALPYLVTQSLGRPEADIGIALGVLIGGAVVTPPFWAWAARAWGERAALSAAMAVFALSATGAAGAIALALPWFQVLAILAAAGFGFAGLQVIPFAMLAHAAQRESARTGAAQEATFTGLWTAGEKLGLASGPALVALALSLAGSQIMAALVIAAPVVLLLLSRLVSPSPVKAD
jgi:Na+/melibiose symporter-like transporter